MATVDGPTLREVRINRGVSLRRVALTAKYSHGHLSKVERGEPGRPVTPRILAAYEHVCGVPLTWATTAELLNSPLTRRAFMSEVTRGSHVSRLAATAFGEPLERPVADLLGRYDRVPAPDAYSEPALTDLRQVVDLANQLDLLGGPVAEVVLRWVAQLIDTPDGQCWQLWPLVAALALRAARTATDQQRYGMMRTLHLVALRAAVVSSDADLRAQVLVQVAEQFAARGYLDETQELLRLAGGDERLTHPTQTRLHAVRSLATP